MVVRRSVAIIGGGVVGVSCGLMLAQEGHHVAVIDQDEVGRGCSWGNGAQYNTGSSFPMTHPGVLWRATKWLFDSRGPVRLAPREMPRNISWVLEFLLTSRPEAWKAAYSALYAINEPCERLYRDMLGEPEWSRLFRPNGALHVWRDPVPGPLEAIMRDLRRVHGAPFEEIDRQQLRKLEPALSPDYQRGMFFPGSGHVTSPFALVQGLMGRTVALGAQSLRTKVTAVQPGPEGVTLLTEAGPAYYDAVVISAGIASRDFARSMGIRLSLASERGYHVTYPGVADMISRPVTDAASAFVATPLHEGLRVVGIAEFDSPEAAEDLRQPRKLEACVRSMLPELDLRQGTSWMGVRPSTPDSLPVIAAHPEHPHIIFATGHGHMGISGAPMTAALVCDLVGRRSPRISCQPYRLR